MEKKSFLRNVDTARTIDYVKNGELFEHAQVSYVMIESSADLANLEGYGPGSIAYLQGFTAMWQLGADDQWTSIV